MKAPYKNIVVIGASYVGLRTAQEIARICPASYRVLLIERNTHFNHLFTFPRFAVLPGHEHKAFVPFTGVFAGLSKTTKHQVINASVTDLEPHHVCIDRDWESSRKISFEYLAIATGTQLCEPGRMVSHEKHASVQYLREHQQHVRRASSIVVIGAGAVGVQIATDLKDLYPDKSVTLVHSRDRVMNRFNPELHQIVCKRLEQFGVKMILGQRVCIPETGFPKDGSNFQLVLSDGHTITSDLAILCTGQTPNTQILENLPRTKGVPFVNPENGFIRVLPTMQIQDPAYPYMFAVGDVADTMATKAARPGYAQAEVAAKNIEALIEGQPALAELEESPAGIRLSLGLRYNVAFRNPQSFQSRPHVREYHDGQIDHNVDKMWQRLNVVASDKDQYNL